LPESESFKKYKEVFTTLEQADKNKKAVLAQTLTLLRKNIAKELNESPTFAAYAEPLKKLLPYISDAYLECAVENYMPAYTPTLILLGLLYKKTNLNRDTVEIYYKYLQEKVDCLNVPADWTAWKKDTFKGRDLEVLTIELQNTPLTHDNIQKLYEKFVFIQLSPTNFPPELSYSTATITNGSESASFADCMDSTIRNVINFLSYNPQTGLFDPALLAQRLGTTLHPSLKAFYNKHDIPVSAGETNVHSDWAQSVISNIPFVSYDSALPHKARTSDLGFIKIPEALSPKLDTFLKDKKYTVLDNSEIAYELNPSMKNLIIVLDYLLGLQLFTEEPLEKAFIRTDFVEFYLPKLAAALKTSLPEIFVETALKEIDKRDYTFEPITLPLILEFLEPIEYVTGITIKTTSGHGQFFSPESRSSMKQPRLITLEGISTSLLTTNPNFLTDEETTFLWLFSQPIDNPDFANNLLDEKIKLNKDSVNLLIFVAQKHPDEIRKFQMMEHIYTQALSNNLTSDTIVTKAIKAAQEAVNSTNSEVQKSGLNLFLALVEKNKAFDEATKTAQEALNSSNLLGIGLFEELVAKDKAFNEATKAAQDGLKSTDFNIQFFSLQLFQYLVAKGKAFNEATKAAQDGLKSLSLSMQTRALELFQYLVAEGKAFNEAIKAAQEPLPGNFLTNFLRLFRPLNYNDRTLIQGKLKLFKALVEKKQAFNEAFKAAQDAMKFTDEETTNMAQDLMLTIKKIFPLETAAKKLIKEKPNWKKQTQKALQQVKIIKEIPPITSKPLETKQ